MIYPAIIKKLLFLMDPEKAHHRTVWILKKATGIPFVKGMIRQTFAYDHVELEREVFGLRFKNPVGLAAGFDKDGKFFREMAYLGFGFIEIGTVTPLPQSGNPRPRLFRIPEDEGIINRMGFNNDGVDAMVNRLKSGKPEGVILGGNIGKNKVTPNENAINDYLICFEKLYDYVDYFVVNVSSPNTPGLRDLQDKGPLTKILSALMDAGRKKPSSKPILLKIAPDLSNGQLDDIIDIVKDTGIAGVVATNTTISRDNLVTDPNKIQKIGNGGLSGAPLRDRSTEVIRYLHQKSKGAFPIIGVGGIDSPDAVKEKLDAGASLVQIFSGFIYQGPGLVKKINKSLVRQE